MRLGLFKRPRSMLGFTMIELLVVIAIIGVLAVAVLSAINPLEQINKGKDTRARSDAAEILNGVDRYFATQELFPWNKMRAGNPGYNPNSTDPADAFVVNDANGWNWLYNLSDVDEVKSQFAVRLSSNNSMVLYKEAGATSPVHVCFIPSSKQFMLEAARKCCTTTDCPNDSLAGSQVGNVILGSTTLTLCNTTNGNLGTQANPNYICLP